MWQATGSGGKRTRFTSRRRLEKKKVAREQMHSLFNQAVREHALARSLAERHARISWNLSTRFNERLSAGRIFFCHHCKQFIVPPTTARFRLSSRRFGMNVTCLRCGKIYRKLFSKAK